MLNIYYNVIRVCVYCYTEARAAETIYNIIVQISDHRGDSSKMKKNQQVKSAKSASGSDWYRNTASGAINAQRESRCPIESLARWQMIKFKCTAAAVKVSCSHLFHSLEHHYDYYSVIRSTWECPPVNITGTGCCRHVKNGVFGGCRKKGSFRWKSSVWNVFVVFWNN